MVFDKKLVVVLVDSFDIVVVRLVVCTFVVSSIVLVKVECVVLFIISWVTNEIVGGFADSFTIVTVEKKLVVGFVDSFDIVVVWLIVFCLVVSSIVWVKEEGVVIFIGGWVTKELVGVLVESIDVPLIWVVVCVWFTHLSSWYLYCLL